MSNLEELERARELYIRYAAVVDEGEHEQLLNLFTPDGVFESSWLGRFEGHAGLRRQFEANRSRAIRDYQMRHVFSNLNIKLDGDRGHADYYVSVYVTRDGITQLLGIGKSSDELRRVGGTWYFKSRHVTFDTKKPEILT
ncbi:MAG TPA: nuclear transport factor 2 family protein [Candidatus Binataceae bacterium]|nr:nuclear transport factor 2 family protein [Candidatus Binataceae bacterium]